MKRSAARVTFCLFLAVSATRATAATQLLTPTTLARYKAALPKVADPDIQAILTDEGTLWYDHQVMIPSYQDSVGDGSYTPIGARANNAGKPIIVPEGQKFFTDDGQTFSFPFGHTAGADESDNMQVAEFVHLPRDGATFWPIVYWTVDDPYARFGLGLHQWTWMYPVGAVVGEMIYVRDAAGRLFPAELRTRTRYAEGWTVNVYRPFPTARELAGAIKAKRANWASSAALSKMIAHLENSATLTPATRSSPGFNDVVELSGYLDEIPDFGDDALVKELLTTTTFMPALGAVWKADGNRLTFAASSRAGLSIVPRNYFAGLIEVSDESCNRCHAEAGRSLATFEDATLLYGDLWGNDRIFSFHPWDQSRYSVFNYENRSVRPELRSGAVVERYDMSRHPAAVYRYLGDNNP